MKFLGLEIIRSNPTLLLDVSGLECVADDLGNALYTYAELLDNNCRDHMVLDVARERIADLSARYQTLKLEELSKDDDTR